MHVHADAVTFLWFLAFYLLVSAMLRAIQLAYPDSPWGQALAVIH